MKLALLGGSFNPLHIGHCMLAETVARELGYDRILFVPVYNPPHKEMNNAVSAEDRLKMVEAFCASSVVREDEGFCQVENLSSNCGEIAGTNCTGKGSQIFFAEDCEIRRKGVSYTYDTIQYVIEKYGNELEGKPAFILGQESAAQFYKWHRAEEIAKLCDLIIARRHPDNNGVDVKAFENKSLGSYTIEFVGDDFEKDFKYPHIMLSNPILPVSSTEIRSRIAGKKAFRYLVPEAVFHYIIENKLYGFQGL